MNLNVQNDLSYWLAASHLLKVSLPKLLAWLESRNDFQSLFTAETPELKATGFTESEIEKIKKIYWPTIEAEQKWYETHGTILTLKDPRYPVLLKELADPPLVLYVSGDSSLLSAVQLGMVGSRHPSPQGSATAEQFARALSEKGLVITSGLAAGIDAACHRGALAARGKTIAVMGTGLNQIYPSAHQGLAEKLVQEGGAVVSEFPLNTPPSPWNFPRRNRIISGLSLGVLVVEAALRSGSLITARYAMEQNREVFAIPGSINQPLARGCHQLLRQGAKLVETVDDIIEELGTLKAFAEALSAPPLSTASAELLDEKQRNLLNNIEYSVTALDSIMLRSGLTATEVSSMLLLLELKGYVQAVSGGYLRCLGS